VPVLGEPAVSCESLGHGRRNTATLAVWRVHTEHRRAVVKVLSTDPFAAGLPRADDASHPYFVGREPLLYERGLPHHYTEAGIATPRLLGRVDHRDAVELWLEELDEPTGSALTVADYAAAARRLGRAHGRELAGDHAAFADFPWSRDFLARYVSTWDDVGWERVDRDDAWNAPLIRDHFPPDLRTALVELCRDRATYLRWADELPAVICHNDVWPNNVFASAESTTLIDWAFAGRGHLGSDPGNLVTDSCGDLLFPTGLLPELDEAATRGYQAGLIEGGWRGDRRVPRFGMCVMAAKWAWLVPHMLGLAANDAHAVYGDQSVDSNELFAARAAMLAYNAALAAEARALARDLGFR
jgi:hypothetical protein